MSEFKDGVFILIVGFAFLYSGIRSRKKRIKNGETSFRSVEATSIILGIGFVIFGFFKIIMFYVD